MQTEDQLVPAAPLKAEFGNVSDMWLWRRLNDPDDDFPRPIYIAGRRYWRRGEVEEYKRRKAAQSPRTAPRPGSEAKKESADAAA